jgi:hypothetical protein
MTDRLIKDFSTWRLFEAAEGQDPVSLYRAGDRKGLMALAAANDSAEVKAKPGYAQVVKWWTDGQGDLSFWKSVLKSGRSVEADRTQSLKSAYYWAGYGSNANSAGSYDQFMKAVEATIAAKPKVDAWIATQPAATKAKYSTAWIDGLTEVKTKLDAERANGFEIKANGMNQLFVAAYRDNAIDTKSYSDLLASASPADSILRRLAGFKPTSGVDALIAQKQTYFGASIKLTEADKISILDSFAAKAKAWADRQNKKKPGSETLESAIAKATSLHIAPKNVTIETKAAAPAGAPVTTTATFSYPANPKGDETSEAFKKGLQMFPDDGTTIGAQALAELNASVKEAVDNVVAAGGKITGVTTHAWSSTSKVPTKYGSADSTWKAENNVQLANDRLAAINAALATALTEAGVTAQASVDSASNQAAPNQGPEWGDAQRRDPKYGTVGARTQAYQDEYGKWRFASAFFTLTYVVETTDSQQTAPTATPSGTWKSVISWADESISITITPPKFGSAYGRSKPVNKAKSGTACPSF